MAWFTIEHGNAAYTADFVIYAIVVGALALHLGGTFPVGAGLPVALCVLIGLLAWTLVEYGLHRFVLHGLQPFIRWHERHHAKPTGRISLPTLVSLTLIAGLWFFPAWLITTPWVAQALTLGLTAGYFGYSILHHGLHHWHGRGAWFVQRRRWHAQHHRFAMPAACFGVTTPFWDRVFNTGRCPRIVHPLV